MRRGQSIGSRDRSLAILLRGVVERRADQMRLAQFARHLSRKVSKFAMRFGLVLTRAFRAVELLVSKDIPRVNAH